MDDHGLLAYPAEVGYRGDVVNEAAAYLWRRFDDRTLMLLRDLC